MKVIFLGTNGWFDTDTGNTICTLVKTSVCNIVLDAGYGIHKIDRYLDVRKPTYIFLSHLHLDHIVGLHVLVKFRFPKGVTIYVPQGMSRVLRKFFVQPFTLSPEKLPFKVHIQTVSKNFCLPGVKISSLELIHVSKCVGYRFEVDRKIIAYCTDTGICENALRLAGQANLLVSECALKKGQKDEGWPHLNPVDAALLAKKAGVKQLVLTHFDAHNYQRKRERRVAQAQAKKIFPNSFAAFDGMELRV